MHVLNQDDHVLAVPLFAPLSPDTPALGVAYVPQVGLVPLVRRGWDRVAIGTFRGTTAFGPFVNTHEIRAFFSEITQQ